MIPNISPKPVTVPSPLPDGTEQLSSESLCSSYFCLVLSMGFLEQQQFWIWHWPDSKAGCWQVRGMRPWTLSSLNCDANEAKAKAASPHGQVTLCCQRRFQDEMEFTAAFPSPSTHFSMGSRHNINKDPSHPHSEVKWYNLIPVEIRTSSGMSI